MCKSNSKEVSWRRHAVDRRKERGIEESIECVTNEYIKALPYYTNSGCFHYCDVKNGVIYYMRGDEIVTVIKRNPIQMCRRICEIRGWKFESICRDNLFGRCSRGGGCRYEHRDLF